MTSFSPGRRSFIPTPYGRDIQDICTDKSSRLTQQIAGIPTCVPVQANPHHDDFHLSDLDLDIDFSMYLNSPNRPSTASSSSRTEPNFRGSVERRSISPLQLTNHDNICRDNREIDLVSKTTAGANQAHDPVTGEDLQVESVVSLLLSLKSRVFPRFDTASLKYDYKSSMLSNLVCADCCEWMCHEVEELLGFYLEKSLRSIRKRRITRVQNALPSEYISELNERRQGFEYLNGPHRRSITPLGQMTWKSESLVGSCGNRSCFLGRALRRKELHRVALLECVSKHYEIITVLSMMEVAYLQSQAVSYYERSYQDQAEDPTRGGMRSERRRQ